MIFLNFKILLNQVRLKQSVKNMFSAVFGF